MTGVSDHIFITCPSCRTKWELAAQHQSRWFACSCRTLIGPETGKTFPKLEREHKFFLELGVVGELKGVKWKIVGMTRKQEAKAPYFWEEYTLFNPYHGYRGLSVSNGHWTFFTPRKKGINWKKDEYLKEDDTIYYLFNRYNTRTVSALGEFTESPVTYKNVHEYIAPPNMILFEKTDQEIAVSDGEYISSFRIAAAFRPSRTLPAASGVGQLETRSGRVPAELMKRWAIIISAVMVVIQFFFVATADNQVLTNQTLQFDEHTSNPVQPMGSFDLPASSQNLLFELRAPVSNNWAAANIHLVNTTTNDAWDFSLGVEYYFGVTSGESWSEGSTSATRMLSGLPAGKYVTYVMFQRDSALASSSSSSSSSTSTDYTRLFTVDSTSSNTNTTDYSGYTYNPSSCQITITRDIPIWQNFFIILILVMAIPLYLIYSNHTFEKQRWMNTDFKKPAF